MSTVRFEPIALQLSKLVSMDSLLPRDAVERLRRERPKAEAGERPFEPDVDAFMLHYMAVARAGFDLLGAPQFERLSRLFAQIQEEYMPGGPPMSPVYDSYVSQHVLSEVPHGPANETPYTVLARLASDAPGRERLARMARALADSHLELYRVRSVTNMSAELERVRDGSALSVRLTGPFLRTGDRVLARVVPFEGGLFIADSPYLLAAPEAQWLAYLERVSSREARAAHAKQEGNGKAAPARAKLSSKQLARLRQQKKAAAQGTSGEGAIVRHFKYGESERYWLDYIMDGYAGERRGIVRLAGVPDIPETLPHHAEYDPELAEFDAPADDESEASSAEAAQLAPMPRLREALLQIAEREGIFAQAERELGSICEAQGLTPRELYPAERFLFTAYCTLGARSAQGLTALEHLERERELDAEQRELVASLERGWFSVFRLDRIHLDRGFEVLDVLRRKKLEISERSATRQAATGDLLLGWVCQDEGGTLTLEGGVLHVPSLLAPAVIGMAKDMRDTARDLMQGGDFRQRAAELPPALLIGTRLLRELGPDVRLQNTSGHDLQLATGRYTVRDAAKVAEALGAEFETLEDGEYAWYDDARTLLASFELSGSTLRIRVNSRERLQQAKARLEALLGAAIAPSLDVLEGDSAALTAAARGERSKPPLELPPELARQFHGMLLERIRGTLDQPIPMFKGKTLRQLARAEKTRPDAVSWLREQERILASNPQMTGLDLRPLWSELGLPYQGLSTDR